MNKIKVSESELEVLKVVWDKKNTTGSQIVDILLLKTSWSPKTIQTLITRLVKKGALLVDKTNKRSYIYSPAISEEQYKKVVNESFINKVYNGSLNLMISTFMKDYDLSDDEIHELKNLLDRG